MMTLFLKSYLSIFLSVGLGCLTIFILGFYLIIKTSMRDRSVQAAFKPRVQKSLPLHSASDITAIAGDDIIATQLDLARAYIEINQKTLAETILDSVLQQGNVEQQEEARHLLTYLG